MIISDIAIKRPVFATMVILALVIFGAIGLRNIGIDLFPRVEIPTITIVAELPGADPETVETTVVEPIEEAVATISGVDQLRSTSAESFGQVIVQFVLEKDVDVAYQEVQAKLGTIRSDLPTDLREPRVDKFDIDSAPIMAVLVSADMAPQQLTTIADRTVKERLQKVPNVGQVQMIGDRERKMWLWLDGTRLEGYQLSVQDVRNALLTEHVEFPGGRIETGPRELLVKTKAEFRTAEGFDEMVVASRNGATVRLRDVGYAEDGLEEQRTLASLDGKPAIALLVRKQSGTNTVQVANAVHEEVEQLRQALAAQGITLVAARDQSEFIQHSIAEIQLHLVLGGLLAVFIVWVFLRNFRITVISALAIPTSVISTFALMNAMGFTMNNLTMLALSLSIGLLIDDAIVVVENIFRHVEEGSSPREAASFGTAEIGLAVFAITMSIVAVFVPVAFMEGIIGRFFYQFGLTVAFAVLISLLVAFSLVPMLSSRYLHHSEGHNWLYRISERVLESVDTAYGRLLGTALNWRLTTVVIGVAALVAAVFVARVIPTEFLPAEDQSEFSIRVDGPLDASLSTTEGLLNQVRERIVGQPWLEYTLTIIGGGNIQRVDQGSIYVRMVDKAERDISQQEAMAWMRREAADIEGATVSVESVPRIGGGGGRNADLQVELRGTELSRLEAYSERLMERLRSAGGYQDVDSTYEKGKPEVNVYVDRTAAADLDVVPSAIASTVRSLIGGEEVAKFKAGDDRFDVAIRLLEAERSQPEDVGQLTVRSRRNQLVRLESVADVRQESGPIQIDRFNRARQITVLANLTPGEKVLGQAVTEVNAIRDELNLEPGYTLGFAGTADTMRESFGHLLFALFLSVIMIYMVLASQFESFVHPFTIMFSLPFSAIGALGALAMSGQTISIFTMIGFIMLMGLVTKNAILLVDYTNTLRSRDGMARREALLKAGVVRLRPILMTTFAMVFGMLPIALSSGTGSESRAPMATAVIGGLLTSTLLTLVVVPVLYTLMEDMQNVRQWRLVRRITGRMAEEAI